MTPPGTSDAIVLAAGVGRRLGLGTRPKWLAPLGEGRTPAAVHLEAFAASPRIGEVIVVAGHGAGEVETITRRWAGPVSVVHNPRYAEWNNWYSLLCGLDRWLDGEGDAAWIVNSDLCAPPGWFVEVFAEVPAGPAALVVDRRRVLSEEAMKVAVDHDRVRQVAKVGVEGAVGEYVGLTWLGRQAAGELRRHLASIEADPAGHDHWYEHGIQRHIDAGGAYAVIDVPDGGWVEVDTPGELDDAAALLASAGAATSPRQ